MLESTASQGSGEADRPHARLTGRLSGVQVGRAVAATTVVITHAIVHPLKQSPELVHLLGRYGVTIFFVISGYIMVRSTGSGRFHPVAFILNRIRRIVPLYWIAILSLVVLTIAMPHVFKTTVFIPERVIKSLFFIPDYAPGDSGAIYPFFKLGWTLNYEMFFYVCFAGLFFLNDLWRAVIVTGLFTALFVTGLNVNFTAAAPKFYVDPITLAFAFGVWVAVLSTRGYVLDNPLYRALAWLGSAALLLVIAIEYEVIHTMPGTQVWLGLACAVQVWLLASIAPARYIPRWAVYAGDASYSMYLWHMFPIGLVTGIVMKFAPSMMVAGMAIASVFGIAIGLFVYQFLEVPLNKLMRRLSLPRRQPGSSVPALSPADGL